MADSFQDWINACFSLATLQREGRVHDARTVCRGLIKEAPELTHAVDTYNHALDDGHLGFSSKLHLVLHGRLAELGAQPVRDFLPLYDALFERMDPTSQDCLYFAVLLERLAALCPAPDKVTAIQLLIRTVDLLKQVGRHVEVRRVLGLLTALEERAGAARAARDHRFELMLLEAQQAHERVPYFSYHPEDDCQPPGVSKCLAEHGQRLESLFYPGAGEDWGPLQVFRKHTRTFIYVDYFLTEAAVRQFFVDIPGFVVESIQSLSPKDFGQDSWAPFWQEDEACRFGERGPADSFALRADLRCTETGARSQLYYLGTEAIATFDVLCASGQKPGLVVCQEHGCGGQWTPFGGCSLLYAAALAHNALPAFLYIGLDQTDPWPQYVRESKAQVDNGQMHHFPRALFGRRPSRPRLPDLTFADVYDLAHKGHQAFSQVYDAMTAQHLVLIRELFHAGPCGRILEVGSATGRLSVPICRFLFRGYAGVVSLDSDPDMLSVLKARMPSDADARTGTIQDFRLGPDDEPFALALLLFNTVAHLQTKLVLLQTIDSLWHALVDGGSVLIDLPITSAFRCIDLPMPDYQAHRSVDLKAEAGTPFYHWVDSLSVEVAGVQKRVVKTYTIREWSEDELLRLYEARGFQCINRFPDFEAFGSTCFQFRKPTQNPK